MTIQRRRRFLPFAPAQRTVCRSVIFPILLALIVFLPALSGAQQACQPDGDVDRNGSVTAADALLAFQQALGLAQLTACQRDIADVFPQPASPDGNITASDALCIFQKALSLPSCLDTLPSTNQPPVADAGLEQFVFANEVVTLSGSGSDTDGTIVRYRWVQTSGPTVVLSGADTPNASFTAPEVTLENLFEELEFQLTVTDDDGASDTAIVLVIVLYGSLTNEPPTANAGLDQRVDENTLVTLLGSGTDSDGTIIAYQWIQIGGTPVPLFDADTLNPSFTAPEVDADEDLVFELTVVDNELGFATDTVTVTIFDTVSNTPPVAVAGRDQTVDENTQVTLSGVGSDSDGTIAYYEWIQISGTTVTISGAYTRTATFTAPEVDADEDLVFELTVTDDGGASDTDTVTVTVRNAPSLTALPSAGVLDTKVNSYSTSNHTVEFDVDVFAVGPDSQLLTLSPGDFVMYRDNRQGTCQIEFEQTGVTLVRQRYVGPYSATFLLDQSGSITSTDPQDARIQAAVTFMNNLSSGDEVGLLAFAENGQLPYSPVTSYSDRNGNAFTTDSNGFTSTLQALAGLEDGGTPLYQAVKTAVTYTVNRARNSNRAVLVFTDGEDTEGGVTLQEAIDFANMHDVTLHTVALSQGVDLGVLSEMASETGGSLTRADDARQLISYYGALGPLLSGSARFYRTSWRSTGRVTSGQQSPCLPSRWTMSVRTPNMRLPVTFDLDYGESNTPPVAVAGRDQTVDENTQVTLSGVGSDSDGTIAYYEWIQISGTTVTISGAYTRTATFTAPEVDADEDLVFELTVTDDGGASDTDTVTVTVRNAPSLTALPSAGVLDTKVNSYSTSNHTVEFDVDVFAVGPDSQLLTLSPGDFVMYRDNRQGTCQIEFEQTGVTLVRQRYVGPYSATFLLDQSGSITSTDPQDARIQAAVTFMNNLSSGDEVGLLAFAENGQLPYSPVTSYSDRNGNAFTTDSNGFTSTLQALAGLEDGGTPLYQAVKTAVTYTVNRARNSNRAVLVFTDGEDTEGGVTLQEAIDFANMHDVTLHTVALSQGVDLGVLSEMASETGGSLTRADDARQLISYYGALGPLLSGSARFYRTSWRSTGRVTSGQQSPCLPSRWTMSVRTPNMRLPVTFDLDYQ